MSSECDVCCGHLRVIDENSLAGNPARWKLSPPCPHCLTTPATNEIRAVARECMGFSPWASGHDAWYADPERRYPLRGVVPLHLPMGRALACEVLARRWGWTELYGCPRWEEGLDGWILTNRSRLHAHEDRLDFVRHEVSDPWHGVVISVPALASIPADAPPDLRLARALTLALEGTHE